MNPSDRVWRERALRSAVLAGDERAWQAWYEESYGRLAAYVAWRCAGLIDLRAEILQETWLTAVRRIRVFDPERSSFANWLRGIASQLLLNHFRRQARRQRWRPLRNGQALRASTTDSAAEQQEIAECVAATLSDLAERYEAVLRAKYLDAQSVEQIAQAWKETPKAVESLLTRARQAFREAYRRRQGEHHA
jgi:RNA polymerase sigma-70 factor (ECF subfamily)